MSQTRRGCYWSRSRAHMPMPTGQVWPFFDLAVSINFTSSSSKLSSNPRLSAFAVSSKCLLGLVSSALLTLITSTSPAPWKIKNCYTAISRIHQINEATPRYRKRTHQSDLPLRLTHMKNDLFPQTTNPASSLPHEDLPATGRSSLSNCTARSPRTHLWFALLARHMRWH